MSAAGSLLTPRVRLLMLVALVLAGAGALFAVTQGDEAATLTSYYYRAHLTIDQQAGAADDSGFPAEQPLDTIEAWYQAPDKWAWAVSDSRRPTVGSLQVADGAYIWYYDRPTNTHSKTSYAEYYDGRSPDLSDGPPPITGAALIGALPYNDPERLFAAFEGQNRSDSTGGIVAGRPTRTVTFTKGEQHTTFWLDREYAFSLKYVSHGPDFSVTAEALEVSFDQALSGKPFVFEPPPGSREVPPPRGPVGSSGSMHGGDVPAGFLSVGHVPEGYVSSGQGREQGSNGETSYVALRYQPRGVTGIAHDYLLVEEQYRAGGLAPSQSTGTTVALGAFTGYVLQDGNVQRLVFARGDIVVTLSSNALPLDQLVAVAASLE